MDIRQISTKTKILEAKSYLRLEKTVLTLMFLANNNCGELSGSEIQFVRQLLLRVIIFK